MALRRFCVGLAPNFLQQTRASVGVALHGLSRRSFSTSDESGEGDAEGGSERVSPQVRESSSSSASFYGGGGGYQERGRSRSVGTTDAGTDNFDLKLKSVSENRLFYPGQTYETDDLAPRLPQFSVDMFTTPQKTMRAPMRGRAVDKQLLQTLDFRNARLLTQFVSDTGKILPKRKTGLSSKVQRKMSRVIKLSRVMGILPFTEKLKIPSGRRN